MKEKTQSYKLNILSIRRVPKAGIPFFDSKLTDAVNTNIMIISIAMEIAESEESS